MLERKGGVEDLEDEELEEADDADLANLSEGEGSGDEFIAPEDGEAAPPGMAAHLARGYEPQVDEAAWDDEGDEFKDQHGISKEAALAEVKNWWPKERKATYRRADIIAQYRVIEELGEEFEDRDIAFMLDALFLIPELDREEDLVWDLAQAEGEAGIRAALKKRGFRFQGRVALLTYIAEQDIKLSEMVEKVRVHNWHGTGVGEFIYEPPKFSVGLERAPLTGKLHFHVFIDFKTKMNIKGNTRFRMAGAGIPNIKTVTKGTYKDALEYTMKGGSYMFSDKKELWLPRNSRGFKTAEENHNLWVNKVNLQHQKTPFPFALLGPEAKVIKEPKAGDKKRHWVIKSAPDAGKSWWAQTIGAGARVFFPRKGNKYPLEGKGSTPLKLINTTIFNVCNF